MTYDVPRVHMYNYDDLQLERMARSGSRPVYRDRYGMPVCEVEVGYAVEPGGRHTPIVQCVPGPFI